MDATSAYLNLFCRSYEQAVAECETYAERRRNRERAYRQHLRFEARNTIADIKGGRHDLVALDMAWPDCPAGVRTMRRDQQAALLRYLRKLRSQHTVLTRLRRAAE